MIKPTIIFVIALGYLTCVHANSGGAPTESCESMIPQHGQQGTRSNNYYVKATPRSGQPRQWVIEISSPGPFYDFMMGFMIQARPTGSTGSYQTVGTFQAGSSDTKAMTCKRRDDTATQLIADYPRVSYVVYWSCVYLFMSSLRMNISSDS